MENMFFPLISLCYSLLLSKKTTRAELHMIVTRSMETWDGGSVQQCLRGSFVLMSSNDHCFLPQDYEDQLMAPYMAQGPGFAYLWNANIEHVMPKNPESEILATCFADMGENVVKIWRKTSPIFVLQFQVT